MLILLKAIAEDTFNESMKKSLLSSMSHLHKLKHVPGIIGRIDKQIATHNKNIAKISGNYRVNTYKRMNEERRREKKRQSYRQDIKVLEFIREKIEDDNIQIIDYSLLVSSFRQTIEKYSYSKFERGNVIIHPCSQKCPVYQAEWYKKEAELLKRGSVFDDFDINIAVDYFNIILRDNGFVVDFKQEKIRELTQLHTLKQQGDVFFTPSHIAQHMVELAGIDETSRVLEPSAGIGVIADEIRKVTSSLSCIECRNDFREILTLKGHNVEKESDFMEFSDNRGFDAVVMNPPFSKELEHLRHAFKLVKPGGRLVTITSPHWTFAREKKCVEFREWFYKLTAEVEELPSGTFEFTGVASRLVVIYKDEDEEVAC